MIDPSAIRAAVVTISDTRTAENDRAGDKLAELLARCGASIEGRHLVTDDRSAIAELLAGLSDGANVDLILTTGGTGLAQRDNTPEATLDIIERQAPGFAEAIRRESAAKTPTAMLSRGIAGTRGQTLIINLPGSPKAVEECFRVIEPVLKHAVEQLRGNTTH